MVRRMMNTRLTLLTELILAGIAAICLIVVQVADTAADNRCAAFGSMASGQNLPPSVTPQAVRQLFIAACEQFPNVGSVNEGVHWWQGLLVQDFVGANNQGDGAIFYDVYAHLGSGQAYVLWGPVLQRYWSNANWGSPQSHRTEAPRSAPNGISGHFVRFRHDLDVYYNQRAEATYVIRGVTRDRFNALGGTGGFLGFPESEGLSAASSGYSGTPGWYQNFEGGIMHTCECNGVWQAWEVHGAIQATYNSLEGVGSGSALGFPLSGEIDTGASPVGTVGRYQQFEGGRIYYDSLQDDGTTFVLYSNIESQMPSGSGVNDARLGFPIEKQQGVEDCRVYFELGYVDCQLGIKQYSGWQDQPSLPALSLPYAQNTPVNWTGGPHAYAASLAQVFYNAGYGSGIDFAMGGRAFDVFAMTGGTVVEVVRNNCDSEYGLGCRIAIRSDDGGAILVYSHLEPGSLSVTRRNQATNREITLSIAKGMYIFARERIATAGQTGLQDSIHLHVELRDGTGRACSSYCYNPTVDRKFGHSMDWHGRGLGRYGLFGYQKPDDGGQRFNYDGSAVHGGHDETKMIDGHYIDYGEIRRLARMTVHVGFDCDTTAWTCERIDETGRTVFAGHGGLGESPWTGDMSLWGDPYIASFPGGQLISDHNGVVIVYDPNLLTLASPMNDAAKVFLPLIRRD